MITTRKIIEIDEELCDGCGLCVPDCAEGSLKIIDGKAKLVADNLCDGLGACLGACPTGALKVIERAAEEFDEEAVEEYLAAEKTKEAASKTDLSPGGHLQTLGSLTPCQAANQPVSGKSSDTSALTHWPVQIRLVQPQASFLKNSDLLVAADCAAVSAPAFHQDFLRGKVVMMGCPKFDDAELYVQRFTEIFQTSNLKSLTVLIMDVPCCSAMLKIIDKSRQEAKTTLPIRHIILGRQGKVLEEKNW